MASQTAALVASVLNCCWWVRHYRRGKRNRGRSGELRRQAVLKLGLTLREALNATEDDFEPILMALLDGLGQEDSAQF